MMKNRLLILTLAVLMIFNSICTPSFAINIIEPDDEQDASFSELVFDDFLTDNHKAVRLFGADNSQALDYSRIGNTLTVEVKNEAAAASCSLIVTEYNEDDLQTDTHIISDVRSENVIEVHGKYERAFLWDFDNLLPICPSISTKTDYEIVEGNDGDWVVSADGHTLYEYLGEDTNVVIPNSYRGKLIKSVINLPALESMTAQTPYSQINLFGGRNDIESFAISEGIMRIGPCAFFGCEASCPLNLPSTLIYIGDYAFRNCINLTGDVDLPATAQLQRNNGYQFAYCSSLDGTLTLPDVEVIPAGIFYGCKNIRGGINIPEGVEKIGNYAFCCSEAAKFTALTLPSSLKSIGKAAFQYQSNIRNELILPEGLEHIADGAFNHCISISNTALTIPSTLKSIGGDSVDSSGQYMNTGYGCHVFYDSFKSVLSYEVAEDSDFFKAEDGVLYSKDGTRIVAYPTAKTDEEFIVPEGVTQIDEMALAYSKFKTLHLPDSYVISETVPANVINDKANTLAAAVYHYNSLSAVLVNDTNPNYTSVRGVVYSKDKSKLWYVAPKLTGEVAVEEGCTELAGGCCWMEYNNYNGELYTSIYIPESVVKINSNTLSDLNRKVNNSYTRFVINLDSENTSFEIDSEGRIKKRS